MKYTYMCTCVRIILYEVKKLNLNLNKNNFTLKILNLNKKLIG